MSNCMLKHWYTNDPTWINVCGVNDMLIIGNLQKKISLSYFDIQLVWQSSLLVMYHRMAGKRKALKKFKFHLKHTIIIIDILSPPTRNDNNCLCRPLERLFFELYCLFGGEKMYDIEHYYASFFFDRIVCDICIYSLLAIKKKSQPLLVNSTIKETYASCIIIIVISNSHQEGPDKAQNYKNEIPYRVCPRHRRRCCQASKASRRRSWNPQERLRELGIRLIQFRVCGLSAKF